MSNNDEQKKDEAGANSENGESAEVSSTSPDSPIAGGSEEPKDTEEAGSCSTPDHLPDSSVNGKKMAATRIDKSDESSHPQLMRQSGPTMTNNGPGRFTDTFIIEISDEESDSDSSSETSPESSPQPSPEPSTASDGPEHFQNTTN